MSERQSKSVQDRHERMLNEIVKNPGNELCADCGSKNPRWASYSLGVFLCIRCAGIHRKMGTHISKVKSITMDQWTSEQIEMMRTSGGNIAVNSKINPNPGNNPRPLAQDDEHAMEKYIRAKWEKRAFLVENNRMAPLPKTPVSVAAVARLQALPKRSSSVPILATSTSSNTNNVLALNQLREMGFKDEVKNKQILLQTQGSIEAAIEILSRSAMASSSTSSSPAMAQQQQQFMTNEQKVEQLIKLGFANRNSNMDALRRSGGNLDIAMTILNETNNILQQQQGFAGQTQQQQQQHQEPFRSNSVPVLSNQLLIDVDSTPATTTSAMSNPFAMQQQPQQPLQIQYPMQQPQPQQQQPFMYQQQQPTMQSNVFNNPFGLTTTPTSALATTANATTPNLSFNQANMVQQPMQQANFSNPFSQMTPMTSSPYSISNNTSYFMPTSTAQSQQQQPFFNQQQPQQQQQQQQQPFMLQQQPQQQFQYQQQQQTMNPWSSSTATPNTLF